MCEIGDSGRKTLGELPEEETAADCALVFCGDLFSSHRLFKKGEQEQEQEQEPEPGFLLHLSFTTSTGIYVTTTTTTTITTINKRKRSPFRDHTVYISCSVMCCWRTIVSRRDPHFDVSMFYAGILLGGLMGVRNATPPPPPTRFYLSTCLTYQQHKRGAAWAVPR